MLVAAAGPFMNLVLALLGSVVFVVAGQGRRAVAGGAAALIRYLVLLNLMLMFFNLIPLGPLDGAAVLAGLLPRSMQRIVELEPAATGCWSCCCCSSRRTLEPSGAGRHRAPARLPGRRLERLARRDGGR